MRPLKRIATLVLVALSALACVVGLYISAANPEVITVDLLFWPAVAVRSGLLVTLAFSAGAVVGLLVAWVATGARMQTQHWRAKRAGGGR